MDLQKILQTVLMLGADLPAYKALFDQVKELFSDQDQEKLQEAYKQAMANSDAAHKRAQED